LAAWQRSLSTAERMDMPYDRARAHAALAVGSTGPAAQHHRDRALELVAQLNARPVFLGLRPDTDLG
jgi:hypothetical protein